MGHRDHCLRALLAIGFALFLPHTHSAGGQEDDAGTGGLPPDSSGAVAVFVEEGEPLPDVASAMRLMKESGFAAPGYQMQFVDGRRLLSDLRGTGGDILLVGGASRLECDPSHSLAELFPGSLETLLARAEQKIFLTEFEAAAAIVEQIRDSLPCLTEQVTQDLLYRVHFLSGLASFYSYSEKEAIAAFATAAGIDLERPWDKRFPPSAWEAFLQGQTLRLGRSNLQLRQNLGGEGIEVLLDGQALESDTATVSAGSHLVQVVRPETDGEAGAVETIVFDVSSAKPSQRVWLLRAKDLDGIMTLRNTEPNAPDAVMLAELFAIWAEAREHRWLLLVFPPDRRMGEALPWFRFLDVSAARWTSVPEWMTTAPTLTAGLSGADTGPHGKGANIKHALRGWEIVGGTIVSQPLQMPGTRLYGLELGGLRSISGSIGGRVSLSVGIHANTDSGLGGGYMAFLLGVRKTWLIPPFAVYIDGGLRGLRMSGIPGSLGLQVRPGTYVQLLPGGRSYLGVYLAGSVFPLHLPGQELGIFWMGALGLNYRWLF